MDRENASTITEFERGLAGIPQVRHAERLVGGPDYLVRVATADLASYQALPPRPSAGGRGGPLGSVPRPGDKSAPGAAETAECWFDEPDTTGTGNRRSITIFRAGSQPDAGSRQPTHIESSLLFVSSRLAGFPGCGLRWRGSPVRVGGP